MPLSAMGDSAAAGSTRHCPRDLRGKNKTWSQVVARTLGVVSSLVAGLLLTSAASALDLGATAPDFDGTSLLGRQISLADYKGMVVLLDFWATWCSPCRQSLPEYDALRQDLISSGFEDRFAVLAVNVDQQPKQALRALQAHPLSYPSISDPEGTIPERYELPAMPTAYVIDAGGKLRYIHPGYRSGDAQSKLKPQLLRLLKEAAQ